MMVKQDLVKKIKEYFNLNIYETKVWLALLSKGIASAGEIAEISGVPRSRTYDVLESLEKRGFAIVKIGKPVKYIAVKPTEVLEKMKTLALNQAQEKVDSLGSLKETQEYAELEQLHTEGITPIKSHDLTGSMKGRANILARVRELMENAEKDVLICTSAEDFEDKARVLLPTIQKLNQSAIKVKIALAGEEDKVKKLNAKHGLNAKHVQTPARLFMADKKEACFMITPEGADEDIGIWLNAPYFTSALSGMVEQSLKN